MEAIVMNTGFSHNTYLQLQSQLRLERWIFFLTTPLIGIFLLLCSPFLKNIPIDWFDLCLSSIAWGAGITTLTQLLTAIFFLRPRIKNQPPVVFNQYPIYNVLKITKNRLIRFSICVGPLVMFTSFTFLSFSRTLNRDYFFNNCLMTVVGSLVISFWSAFIIDALIKACIGKSFLFKFKRSGSNEFLPKKSTHHHFQSDRSCLRTDWYNDVTNPASPVHQVTYRHSDPP
jgi:hypothetical protein